QQQDRALQPPDASADLRHRQLERDQQQRQQQFFEQQSREAIAPPSGDAASAAARRTKRRRANAALRSGTAGRARACSLEGQR
ncbi:MAG TPA: hypothetical protein VGP15_05180, partial [Burkholderiales bacterium]|nr:hypothetical protein [Burkholderiales bacterium]